MTELAPKLSVRVVYEFCRSLVGPLLALLITTSTTQAGIWEEFSTRCLVPIEGVAAPQLDGLVSEEAEPGFLVWRGREGWMLRTANGLDAPDVCVVSQFSWNDELNTKLMAWLSNGLEAGRYEVLPKLSLQSPTTVQSVEWREPRVEVTFRRFDPEWGPYLMIQETDLES